MNNNSPPPFPESDWIAENTLAFAVRDRHPVSPGHTLVLPKRSVPSWFDATPDEQHALMQLITEVKTALDEQLRPDGYNVGFDAGEAAGQTLTQLHVHVIPRYRGDMDDPRGGVRHVIPSRGNPDRSVRPLATGGDSDPFARHVLPLFRQSSQIAIVAAFVQESGLSRITADLDDALSAGARVRLVTGDYLNITQADALEAMLDLGSAWRLEQGEEDTSARGTFEARVIEVATLPGRSKSFHPKSWLFQSERFGIAFVGSSNLSWSALEAGIEWNLRVDRDRDQEAYLGIQQAFESLWSRARILDAAWVDAYAERARASSHALPEGEIDVSPPEPAETPHRVQREALDALRRARTNGQHRALVVLATGLGKTWLAAFDYAQFTDEFGTRPRLLFLAHRRELLHQAAQTYRRLLRQRGEHARIGWFVEDESDLDADLVFASVAKLARAYNLERLRLQRFDYVVIDEVHHAAADSYRRIAAALDPRFMLGLTATPDRTDAADILGLFDDHLAYTADLVAGIELERLVPFHYFGLRDDIDYENIPWRNRRWDPEALAKAVQTEQRMQTLWQAWQAHPGTRTLVFCCSVVHASYVRGWLREHAVRVNAVFAAEGSDDRDSTLENLRSGELDAVCAVDIFNEGVDLPAIDRVVMLRPTESGVVFLQQLGRGLRAHAGKTSLTVIDFVGNHREFLGRLHTLLSLNSKEPQKTLQTLLTAEEPLELPAGCSVDVQLEAKELLQRLYRTGGADEVERVYRQLRATRGHRPSAGELQRMSYVPSTVSLRHGSWFEFVRAEGDLDDEQRRALDLVLPFLRELEKLVLKSSSKLVVLEALLEADALVRGVSLIELAAQSHAILQRSPELWADSATRERFATLDATNHDVWLEYWTNNAVGAWTVRTSDRRSWFNVDDDRLALELAIPADLADPFAELTREIVDYRLAQYRARQMSQQEVDGFVCKVLSNKRDPILKLPNRNQQRVPDGAVDVRLPDGSIWQFRFMKEFVNVAAPPGAPRNQLPDLLRRWFGPRAGQPGTAYQVRFRVSPDGLWAEPVRTNVSEIQPTRGVVTYPDLRAAAGHAVSAVEELQGERVFLPVAEDDPDLFAVRVSGTSMDGGKQPLRDGDWALMRLARRASAGAFIDRVVLVQTPDAAFGSQFQIKRLTRRDDRWYLESNNPSGPTFEPSSDIIPIARLERSIRPEELAPAAGTTLGANDLAHAFGLDELQPQSGRASGHLFIFVDRDGMLEAPDRVSYAAARPRPSETAFVLAANPRGEGYRYMGVGRRGADDSVWRIPETDYATWRKWGSGKEVSRRLPDGLLERAKQVAAALLAASEAGRTLERSDGRSARVLGEASRGGLRIDGGEGGFAERTVSLVDVAWVIVADEDVREHGGLLDEERVNRLRYLEGTPKASTRWIDTGWAIAAWTKARELGSK
jgi:superfamily II DNA or RNA helicase/diadenosine tetraphosphate (Ap4A) HIT family hydrolase/SOS-response transcriptional repressor LexA